MDKNAINTALLEAKNSTQAVKDIVKIFQKQNTKYSLGYICKHANIPSKGYLSEVIHGKKFLHKKYVEGISFVFKMTELQVALFKILVAIDRQKKPDELKRLFNEKESLKKQISVSTIGFLSSFDDWLFAFAVFAAFGLVARPVSSKKIVEFFGLDKKGRIQKVLELFVTEGIVQKVGNNYELPTEQVRYSGFSSPQVQTQFILQFFNYSSIKMHQWFKHPDQSVIEAAVISCRKDEYPNAVQKLRQFVAGFQSDLEASEADDLVVFGVQLFPYT